MRALVTFVAASLVSTGASALTVTLDPTTLPTTQGWTYVTTAAAENAVFSNAIAPDGRAILVQNTGNARSGQNGVPTISYYEQALNGLAPGQQFRLMVEYQPYGGVGNNNFSFAFQLALDGFRYFLGVNDFGPGYVNAAGQQVQRNLPGAFGPKPVVMTLRGAEGVFSVRANGKPFFTDVMAWNPGGANALRFGDFTQSANGYGAWYRIELDVAPVAEPWAFGLFAAGALALAASRARR